MFTVWTVDSQEKEHFADPTSHVHNLSPFHSLMDVSWPTLSALQYSVGQDVAPYGFVPC
jgi:hypothetical protein